MKKRALTRSTACAMNLRPHLSVNKCFGANSDGPVVSCVHVGWKTPDTGDEISPGHGVSFVRDDTERAVCLTQQEKSLLARGFRLESIKFLYVCLSKCGLHHFV